MKSNWKTYKLSEIINLIGGGTPKTTVLEYWNGNIPWLSVVDFGNCNKYIYQTEKSITEKGLKESSTKILNTGQIIISARGTVGALAMLGKDMAFNQSCYGIYANEKTTDGFLYYLLKDNISKIKKNTHGAVFDTITKQTFENIKVSIPEDKAEQTQIAQILSSLDDKIELLQQMNQTLENIAQAIFKEWFVDFNFPGFDGELVDGLPKGWNYKVIKDLGKVVTGNTPASKNPEYFGKVTPFVTPTDFKNFGKLIISANRFLSNGGKLAMQSRLLPIHSIVVTCIGSDMGKVAMNSVECITNQQINSIIPNQENLKDYLYYDLVYKYDYLRNIATGGSTMPIINKSRFEEIEVLIPTSDILENFQLLMNSFNCKIEENIKQLEALTQTRDTLLPKLMSGSLEIN
ncbi:restriction endonuclease subunit S [Elizabethkingia anophelis]|nr:restriction endonuclease subunit S [Elizabethkingia anophelis]MCT3812110.1 restriction endonuclease subunit S [Elizabethkingia anophelis]MCT3819207.1 restriction endonuclease subunit S [Elizabethkingia anophelis]MCT3941589.1 restriction endonuclease subunit S [Elizabethkingia anophelis]MCT4194347.1 restriction endonuclease subunit S [Elizabethkingia anophelis]